MDHFHIPPNTVHLRVRYTGKKPYDRGPFHTYPDRAGYKKEGLAQNRFDGRDKDDAISFFQTWLYFGTLISIFQIGGVEIKETDFLAKSDDQTYLTTKRLDASISTWKNVWIGGDASARRNRAWTETRCILDEVQKYIASFGAIHCPTFDHKSDDHNGLRAPSPISGETLTAIVALAYTLSEAAIQIYQLDQSEWNRFDKYINYTTDLVKGRLESNGWCPLDMRRAFTQLGMDGHYYFALLESPYEIHQHKDCSEAHCVAANVVNEADYRPIHVPTCDRRDEIEATAATNITKQVVAIIKQDGIPVISWQKKDPETRFGLVVRDAVATKMKYVAVSHV
jgi:hypothetical protein